MKIMQLSIFLENKPGHMCAICKKLADEGINILTLSLADTHQFGILRLIVSQWQKAKTLLREAGCVVSTTEVVAIQIMDQTGGLAKILEILESANLNVEYMYAFTYRENDRAILVFRFDEPDAAVKVLQENGVSVLDSVEIYKLH
ncbi:MAG: amino acid-binding protein [Planctomycetia bacterium]|nr:amino acid-binding protein [Planctomycetia bacterium]